MITSCSKPDRHLVVFAKAPRLAAVKRRLAADIGDLAALRFYRQSTSALLRRVGRDPRWRCWLAVTPDRFVVENRAWSTSAGLRSQGAGDLGARMARMFATLPAGPAIIVGSDIPGITAAHVADGFSALARHDAVFGPAPDGGYWAIGLGRRARAGVGRPDRLFSGVRWSSPHALADTRANLASTWSVALLDSLEDVDDGAAFQRWRSATAR